VHAVLQMQLMAQKMIILPNNSILNVLI